MKHKRIRARKRMEGEKLIIKFLKMHLKNYRDFSHLNLSLKNSLEEENGFCYSWLGFLNKCLGKMVLKQRIL